METTATTEVPVYERELQIDASPETVWEFLVDPEKVARWKGLPAMAFDPEPGGGYRIEIIPGHMAAGAFVRNGACPCPPSARPGCHSLRTAAPPVTKNSASGSKKSGAQQSSPM